MYRVSVSLFLSSCRYAYTVDLCVLIAYRSYFSLHSIDSVSTMLHSRDGRREQTGRSVRSESFIDRMWDRALKEPTSSEWRHTRRIGSIRLLPLTMSHCAEQGNVFGRVLFPRIFLLYRFMAIAIF